MRRRRRQADRLGIFMFLGALVGFVIGGLIGFGSTALDAPVLLPFLGAAIGVAAGAAVAGLLSIGSTRQEIRRRTTERARSRARVRHAAHDGWIEGIDLTADAPPPPPPLPPRRRLR
jgi:hypothetical protein